VQKLKPFLVTISVVLLVTALRTYLPALDLAQRPFLLFFTAITISAYYGGALHGLLALALSTAAVLTFRDLEPPYLLFFVDGLVITLVCTRLRESRFKLSRALDDVKKTDFSLRLSESRLRKIFDSNMIGLVFSDFAGRIIEANQYFANLLGVSLQELNSGKLRWQDFTPPEHMKSSSDALKNLHSSQTVEPFEKQYIRRDGTRISVLLRATKLDDNTVVAYALDLSDRKQLTDANQELSRLVEVTGTVAEQLRESQAFLDSVIENIPNMIFVKNAKNLRFVRFNKAGEDLVGVTSEEMFGKNDYDFFPKEQADFFTAKDRAVLNSKVLLEIDEEPILTPRGVRYLHTRKIPILDQRGESQYLLGISEDITDRKIAEKQRIELLQTQVAKTEAEKTAARLTFLAEVSAALSETLEVKSMIERLAKTVIKHMPGWCVIDLEDARQSGIARYAINETGQIVETPTGTKIDNSKWSLSPAIHDRPPSDGLERFLEGKFQSFITIPLTYHDRIFGMITLITNSSVQVFSELDLSVAQDVAKRASLAIENARLYSRASEASRAKSAFLANISHEIRTPLGAMLGFAELALDDKNLDPENAAYISTIVRNGKQLLRIVDDVLDLSKAESDRIKIEKVGFALQPLVEDITSLLQIKASEKGLELKVAPVDSLPRRLNIDPLRLRQILLNMIGNAIKFTDSGSVKVSANYRSDGDGAGLLEFDITDTGIGISQEQADKLFEPFTQADDTMTRRFGGTGLGLFLSRKLARLMGGDVALVNSKQRRGSHFKITIPADVDNVEQPHSAENHSHAVVYNNASDSNHGQVLIVDDAIDNQILVGKFLEKMGLESDVAENGKLGVEKAKTGKYQVVLMDLQMPVMDGTDAVKKLRTDGYQGPVIALTAHAMKGDRERGLESGFDDYLYKPITRQTLQDCLAKFISVG
jgi:two-component system, sensor histidine kinase